MPQVIFLENSGSMVTKSPGIWRQYRLDLPWATTGLSSEESWRQQQECRDYRWGAWCLCVYSSQKLTLPGQTSPPQCQLAQQQSWMFSSVFFRLLFWQIKDLLNLPLCFCVTLWVLSCLCFCTLCSWNWQLFGGVCSVDGLVSSFGYVELYWYKNTKRYKNENTPSPAIQNFFLVLFKLCPCIVNNFSELRENNHSPLWLCLYALGTYCLGQPLLSFTTKWKSTGKFF